MRGSEKGATSEEQSGLLTSVILINVYTLENNYMLALSLLQLTWRICFYVGSPWRGL